MLPGMCSSRASAVRHVTAAAATDSGWRSLQPEKAAARPLAAAPEFICLTVAIALLSSQTSTAMKLSCSTSKTLLALAAGQMGAKAEEPSKSTTSEQATEERSNRPFRSPLLTDGGQILMAGANFQAGPLPPAFWPASWLCIVMKDTKTSVCQHV